MTNLLRLCNTAHRTPPSAYPTRAEARATLDETEARGLVLAVLDGTVPLAAARKLAGRIQTGIWRRVALDGLDDIERRETHGTRLVGVGR